MAVVDDLAPLLVALRAPASGFTGVGLDERDGRVIFTAQLAAFDDDGAVTDIKEQELALGAVADFDDAERNRALARALVATWQEVLDSVSRAVWQRLHPRDLVPADLVTLGNCEIEIDFRKALRAKKRLGKLLVP